jgi:hypothetical protein
MIVEDGGGGVRDGILKVLAKVGKISVCGIKILRK